MPDASSASSKPAASLTICELLLLICLSRADRARGSSFGAFARGCSFLRDLDVAIGSPPVRNQMRLVIYAEAAAEGRRSRGQKYILRSFHWQHPARQSSPLRPRRPPRLIPSTDYENG